MSSRAPLCAWVATCAFAVPSMALAQERQAQDIVDAIVREGPRALAIRAEVEVVRREQQARLVFPNPGLAYSREGAGFTEFFQIEQPLPVFGLRAALSRAGLAAMLAAEADRDARLWELRSEATRLVAGLLAAQARVEVTTADGQVVERLIDVLRVREREGEGSRFDRLRAEQELAELKQAAVAATIAVADARGSLVGLLPAGVTVTRVTGPFYAERPLVDAAALVARAHETRPELRALQFAVDRLAREADVSTRTRFPAPILTGGVKRAQDGDDRQRGGVFGVSVSLPLFDTGARDAARWNAEAARVAAEREAIEQQIHADIMRAVEALSLRQQAVAAGGADTLGAELTSTAEVAYREGEVGILGLLDALRTASRARMRDIEMRLDARLAQVALERAVGEELWP